MRKRAVKISQIASTGTDMVKMLVLQTLDGKLSFPIIISTSDAIGLIKQLENIKVERPLTHDLLIDVIDRMGLTITEVVIHKMSKGIFYTTIYCSKEDGIVYEFDARPSDSLLLAMYAKAPIYVNSDILKKVALPTKEFEKHLEDVDDMSNFDEDESIDDDVFEDVNTSLEIDADESYEIAEEIISGLLDKLRGMKKEPSMEEQLQQAIENEQYELASKLRDAIAKKKKESN
ncbi:MAG: bifunctional nuclease family protein [Bacteroidales bacterium]|nr:bifunctional nuclease family protein [Bacteroidales bacterium]